MAHSALQFAREMEEEEKRKQEELRKENERKRKYFRVHVTIAQS